MPRTASSRYLDYAFFGSAQGSAPSVQPRTGAKAGEHIASTGIQNNFQKALVIDHEKHRILDLTPECSVQTDYVVFSVDTDNPLWELLLVKETPPS